MNNIWTIVKKELKRFFTDRRMLFSMFLPGLLIFCIYTIMGSAMSSITTADDNHTYIVYLENEPTQFSTLKDSFDITVETHEFDSNEIEDVKTKIKNKEVDIAIIYDIDFYENMINYHQEGKAPQVQMYYDSTSNESSKIYNYYFAALNSYEQLISNKFDINNDQNIQYDLASSEDLSMMMLSSILPFLLISFLFSACLAIAPESIAGEKERGTMATLLVTPIKRSSLAIGKIISLSIISLVSSIFTFLGTILSLPSLSAGTASFSLAQYGIDSYLMLLGTILATVLLFISLLSVISTYAKSIKEASNLSLPFMLIATVIGVLSMFGNSNPSDILFIIPFYNSALCFSAIFSLEITILQFILTLVSNIVYAFVLVFLLSKMFNSERIVFTK